VIDLKKCHFSILLFIVFFTVYSSYGGNNNTIDSLNQEAFELRYSDPGTALMLAQKAIQIAKGDSLNPAFVLSLRNAGIALFASYQYKKSILVLTRALSIAETINDSVSISACHSNLHLVYSAAGKVSIAKSHLIHSLNIDIALKDTAGMAIGFNNLAEHYVLVGNYNEGIRLYQRSAEFEMLIGNISGVADSYNNIGTVYSNMGDYSKSIYYYKKALQIYEETDNLADAAMSMSSLAYAYATQGEFDLAIHLIDKSVQIREQSENIKGLAQSYSNKAEILQIMGHIQEADSFFFMAMNLALQVGNFRQLATGFHSQGNFYLSINDTISAISFYQNSLEFAREIQHVELVSEILQTLASLFEHMGKHDKAYYYMKQLNAMKSGRGKMPQDVTTKQLSMTENVDKKDSQRSMQIVILALSGLSLALLLLTISLYGKNKKLKKGETKQ